MLDSIGESHGYGKWKSMVMVDDRIADSIFQQIQTRPQEYSVLATLNLNGDYVSDAAAAVVGGLGMAPGANIGDNAAIFEATHGTAPKHAGLDRINPGSVILSGVMMLEYMGWQEAADLITAGIDQQHGEARERQVRGQRAAAGAGPHDHEVVRLRRRHLLSPAVARDPMGVAGAGAVYAPASSFTPPLRSARAP